jgi:RNA polymerase sigma factor (sigma-70 family)
MDGVRNQTNAAWVERCLHGDAEAWRQLVEHYTPFVLRVAFQHSLSRSEAEDIGQDVFLALAQNLHSLQDPARLPGWLLTTTRRLCWRAVQTRRRELLPDEADLADLPAERPLRPLYSALPSVNELLESWERQEMISLGMGRLNERCRRLLSLLFLAPDEPSYDEIAAQVNLPKGSIGPTRNRCLQQLRQLLDSLGMFR